MFASKRSMVRSSAVTTRVVCAFGSTDAAGCAEPATNLSGTRRAFSASACRGATVESLAGRYAPHLTGATGGA